MTRSDCHPRHAMLNTCMVPNGHPKNFFGGRCPPNPPSFPVGSWAHAGCPYVSCHYLKVIDVCTSASVRGASTRCVRPPPTSRPCAHRRRPARTNNLAPLRRERGRDVRHPTSPLIGATSASLTSVSAPFTTPEPSPEANKTLLRLMTGPSHPSPSPFGRRNRAVTARTPDNIFKVQASSQHSIHTATYAPMCTPTIILRTEHPRALKFGPQVKGQNLRSQLFFREL
jgi:hypothetical protein